MTLREELIRQMDAMLLVDAFEAGTLTKGDFFASFVRGYARRDLLAAGMGRDELAFVQDETQTAQARWAALAPWWEKIQFTGSAQAAEAAVRKLYGVAEICSGTIEEIQTRMQAALTENRLQDLRIEKIICPGSGPSEDGRVGVLADITSFVRMAETEKWEKQGVDSLTELETALKTFMAGAKGWAVGLYADVSGRSLWFENVDRGAADAAFAARRKNGDDPAAGQTLEDYMMRRVLALAEEEDLPVRLQGTLPEEGMMTDAHPDLLNRLMMEHRQARLVLCHMGYPWEHVAGALAKLSPQVYLDMSGAWLQSPVCAARALGEWLECVPYTRIIGFGGDSGSLDGVAGNREMTLRGVANVLARKVENGRMTEEQALNVAKALLHDNAARFCRLMQ